MDYSNDLNSALQDECTKFLGNDKKINCAWYSVKYIINNRNVKVSDIARLQWQLINLAVTNHTNKKPHSCPKSINQLRLDFNGDIYVMPDTKNSCNNSLSEIQFTGHIITCYKSIFKSIIEEYKDKEMKIKVSIISILFDHIILGSNIAEAVYMPQAIVDLATTACKLIDTGIVHNLQVLYKMSLNINEESVI